MGKANQGGRPVTPPNNTHPGGNMPSTTEINLVRGAEIAPNPQKVAFFDNGYFSRKRFLSFATVFFISVIEIVAIRFVFAVDEMNQCINIDNGSSLNFFGMCFGN